MNTFDELAVRMIETAVNLDEVLVDFLKAEIKVFKKQLGEGSPPDDLQKANNIIRNALFVLMMTDDRIRTGIDLLRAPDGKKQTGGSLI